MCDNRTNNNQYDEDPSYSSQNVGYSGRPLLQQSDQHAPLSNQNSSSQYDVRNSTEPTNGPPSQTTQSSQQYSSSSAPADNRTNGSGPGSLDLPSGNKRLHVSNIPFRFRENDLHGVFAVSYSTVYSSTFDLLYYIVELWSC